MRTLLFPSAAVVMALALAGCVVVPDGVPTTASGGPGRPSTPALGFFSRIKVPDGQEPVLQLTAKGAQIFRCEREGKSFQWQFRLPEAELFDGQGQAVARHGKDFFFEHRDGSRLLGTVVAHDKAASDDTLPWLLFSTRAFGKGEFAGVSYVQRLNTRGGMPPQRCSAEQLNRLLRVDFSADFVFYRPRS